MILKEVLTKTIQFFKDKKIESSRLDAELILSHALKISRIDLYVKYEQPLTEVELTICRDFVRRRSLGEPVAYIIQEKGFFGHSFFVQPGVLVPRPETEHLVEIAIQFIKTQKIENPRILDLGCGSGCVGLSLLKEFSQAELVSVDISEVAVQTTLKNSELLNVKDRIQVINSSVEKLDLSEIGFFDCIVSNPPYIDRSDLLLEKNVKQFEPHQALFADENGLAFLKSWTKIALTNLKKPGLIAFEMGFTQGEEMRKYLTDLNVFNGIEIYKDLAGKDRIVKAELKD